MWKGRKVVRSSIFDNGFADTLVSDKDVNVKIDNNGKFVIANGINRYTLIGERIKGRGIRHSCAIR